MVEAASFWGGSGLSECRYNSGSMTCNSLQNPHRALGFTMEQQTETAMSCLLKTNTWLSTYQFLSILKIMIIHYGSSYCISFTFLLENWNVDF